MTTNTNTTTVKKQGRGRNITNFTADKSSPINERLAQWESTQAVIKSVNDDERHREELAKKFIAGSGFSGGNTRFAGAKLTSRTKSFFRNKACDVELIEMTWRCTKVSAMLPEFLDKNNEAELIASSAVELWRPFMLLMQEMRNATTSMSLSQLIEENPDCNVVADEVTATIEKYVPDQMEHIRACIKGINKNCGKMKAFRRKLSEAKTPDAISAVSIEARAALTEICERLDKRLTPQKAVANLIKNRSIVEVVAPEPGCVYTDDIDFLRLRNIRSILSLCFESFEDTEALVGILIYDCFLSNRKMSGQELYQLAMSDAIKCARACSSSDDDPQANLVNDPHVIRIHKILEPALSFMNKAQASRLQRIRVKALDQAKASNLSEKISIVLKELRRGINEPSTTNLRKMCDLHLFVTYAYYFNDELGLGLIASGPL